MHCGMHIREEWLHAGRTSGGGTFAIRAKRRETAGRHLPTLINLHPRSL
jgi:hypothetical protein